jgi:MFS family permease
MARFASLRVRNFRYYFFGQFISVLGNWMQIIAIAALVLDRMHRSGTVLGLVTAMLYVPVLLLGPMGGVIVDRVDKRRLLVLTQVAFAVSVGALGLLVAFDKLALWSVMALAAAQGAVSAFDTPARQTFVHEMVGPDLLANAIGLNMLAMNTARIIGPAIAGLLLGLAGVEVLFLLNSVSFVGAIVALMAMRRDELAPTPRLATESGQVRAGLRYIRGEPVIRTALVMLLFVGGLAYNFPVVLPLLAKETFDMPKEDYGTFFSAMGAGAIVFAFAFGTRTRPSPRRVVLATAALGMALVALSLAPTKLMAYALLPFLGAGSVNFLVTINSTLQLASAAQMRGRVMAVYTMALLGTTPVGALGIGWISDHYGARSGLATSGIATLLAAAWTDARFRQVILPTAPNAKTGAAAIQRYTLRGNTRSAATTRSRNTMPRR